MHQPLGYAVGNALEVEEAIATLQDAGPADLRRLCLALGSEALVLAGRAQDRREAYALLTEALASGAALAKFTAWVGAQGGNPAVAEDVSLLPRASLRVTVPAPSDGYIRVIDAERVGRAAVLLGAGREVKDAPVDATAGIVLRKKVGDVVLEGEALAELCAGQDRLAEAMTVLREAFVIHKEPPDSRPLVYYRVTEDGVVPVEEDVR
jgi:pyrimidine-nucleoside phosphorylase